MTVDHEDDMRVAWMGRIKYSDAYSTQIRFLEARKAGTIPDTMLLLEHDPVYTIGRRGSKDDIYLDEAACSRFGIEVIETDRGGEVTYHGPGQLVAYPIIDIKEMGITPVAYVRMLENAIIHTVSEYGVNAHRIAGKTGVWVGGTNENEPDHENHSPCARKIAAIGVRISGGVTIHGMALNVSTDLGWYSGITPCGMPGLKVTSLERETKKRFSVRAVSKRWTAHFARMSARTTRWSEDSSPTGFTSMHQQIAV